MNPPVTEARIAAAEWHQLPHHMELLRGVRDHIAAGSLVQCSTLSKRRYQRSLLRKIAICLAEDGRIACFVKDLSRAGVGFYSTTYLDLEKPITLAFPQAKALTLSVVRCRQLADYCYEVGAVFRASSPAS